MRRDRRKQRNLLIEDLEKTSKDLQSTIKDTEKDARNKKREIKELKAKRAKMRRTLETCQGPPDFGTFIKRHASAKARRMWKKSLFKFDKPGMECKDCPYKSKKLPGGN